MLLRFFLAGGIAGFSVAADDPPRESDSLTITPKAEHYSAALLLKKEKEPVTEKEREKDMQRKQLGIGETTMLTLTGKDALIGDLEQLTWAVKLEQGVATVEKLPNTAIAFLTVNKDLTQINDATGHPVKREATVSVTTSEGGCKTITFEIVFPTVMEGRHIKNGDGDGTIVTEPKYRMPKDGDTANAGASAKMEVVIEPKNVSFCDISMKEKDMGFVNNHRPSLAKDHEIEERVYSPKSKNIIIDLIGSQRPLAEIARDHQLNQSWAWVCGWHTYDDAGNAKHHIATVHQEFDYKQVNHARQEQVVEVTVAKFNCTVRRNTSPNNKHLFTPKRP